ncbi:MAG: DUF3800 domain-containing protein [Culicoidibacterales bacterium]
MIYGYFRISTKKKRYLYSLELGCDACIITRDIWRVLQNGDTLIVDDIFELIHQIEELPSLLLRFYHRKIELRSIRQPWLSMKQTTPVYLINDVITGMNRLQRYQPTKQIHYKLQRINQAKYTHVSRNFRYYFRLNRLHKAHNPYGIVPPILAESELTVCLDESGSLGFDQNRYFVLGGFVTNRLHTAIHRYSQLETKQKRLRHHKRELKSIHLDKKTREQFMTKLLSDEMITPVCIIVDKESPTFQVGKKREYYNFLVKTLLQKLCECRLILPHAMVNIRIDQQSFPLGSTNSLVEYVNAELRYDEKEHCAFQEISVEYLDSQKQTEIRIADFIVGVVRSNIEHDSRSISHQRLNQRLLKYYV